MVEILINMNKNITSLIASLNIRAMTTFGIIGVLVNVIYVCVFFLGNKLFPGYRLWSLTIAYSLACTFQYAANAKLTFKTKTRSVEQIVRYLFTIACGYLVSTVILIYIAVWLHLSDFLAILIAILSSALLNYVCFSRWVYVAPAERHGIPRHLGKSEY